MIRRSPRSTLFPYTTRIRSRERETQLTDLIYHFHPRFAENPRIHNWQREHVEGGDVLLLSPDVVAVGVGERTTPAGAEGLADRKSTRLNSSHANISYAVFCL